MQLITTLFTGEDLEAVMTIRPRTRQSQDNSAQRNVDEPLISRYTSKAGVVSLIFNPRANIQLRSIKSRDRPIANIPMQLSKRFSRALGKAYGCLGEDKLYHGEGGELYVDTKRATALARRLTLFRGEMTLIPGVVTSRGFKSRGLAVLIDGNLVGALSHDESLNLYDTVDRLDPLMCEFMSAIADEIQRLDAKLDKVLDILQRMEYADSQNNKMSMGGFSWTPVNETPGKFMY